MIVSLCIRQKENGTRLNHHSLLRHTRSLTTTTTSATSWAADIEDQAILQNLVAVTLDTLARPKVPEHIGRTAGTTNGHVHLPHQWLNLTNSKNYEGTTAITGAGA